MSKEWGILRQNNGVVRGTPKEIGTVDVPTIGFEQQSTEKKNVTLNGSCVDSTLFHHGRDAAKMRETRGFVVMVKSKSLDVPRRVSVVNK